MIGSQNLGLPSWCVNCSWKDSLIFLTLELVPFLPCLLALTGDQQKSRLALPLKPPLKRKSGPSYLKETMQCYCPYFWPVHENVRYSKGVSTILIKQEHSAGWESLFLSTFSLSPPLLIEKWGGEKRNEIFASHPHCHTMRILCGL